MDYFKKIGRPTEDEQALVQAIDRVIRDKQIPPGEIPDCHTLDDLIGLKGLVDSYDPFPDNGQQVGEPELIAETDEMPESEDEQHTDLPDMEVPEDESFNESGKIQELNDSEYISTEYDPFSSPIVERSYTSSMEPATEREAEEEDLELEESKEQSSSEDLNPKTKRRAAEQTADVLLKGYARLAPKPFKWLARFPEEKIEKLVLSGDIDPEIEVSEGLTFDDYVKQTNDQIDEIFEVEKETLDEIREPLIEVLMEQKMELTPQQRLGIAVVSHLMQMLTVALKLRGQNNRILAYQKHITALSRTKSNAA